MMTIRLSGLIGFAIYLGIGALFHAIFVGPHFDWTSAWTFGWLLAWPAMLLITFWVLALGFVLLTAAVLVVWAIVEGIKDRNRLRAARWRFAAEKKDSPNGQ